MLPAAFEARRRQQPKRRALRCTQSMAGGGTPDFKTFTPVVGVNALTTVGKNRAVLAVKTENLVNPDKNQAKSWIIVAVSAKVRGTGWGCTRHIPGEQRSTCGASPKRRAVSVATTATSDQFTCV